MDPNANIQEQRRIAVRITRDQYDADDVDRLVELVLALDKWLSAGGHVPYDWMRHTARSRAITEVGTGNTRPPAGISDGIPIPITGD
jgi:DNA-directed RNA polymerase specialized sigma24 family protein